MGTVSDAMGTGHYIVPMIRCVRGVSMRSYGQAASGNYLILNDFEKLCAAMAKLNGAQGRNRTTDTAIFSRMLYQLSYLGLLRRLASKLAPYRKGKAACPALTPPKSRLFKNPSSPDRKLQRAASLFALASTFLCAGPVAASATSIM